MRLDGRRRSNNVQDKRGGSGALAIGGGIGAVIIAALITWISGGNPLDVLMSNSGSLFSGPNSRKLRRKCVSARTTVRQKQNFPAPKNSALRLQLPRENNRNRCPQRLPQKSDVTTHAPAVQAKNTRTATAKGSKKQEQSS